jgi:hypothetical protein
VGMRRQHAASAIKSGTAAAGSPVAPGTPRTGKAVSPTYPLAATISRPEAMTAPEYRMPVGRSM